jgi:Family of unknown function (DUF6356)
MNLIRSFTEHPASVGESYTTHLLHAGCFGVRMMLAGFACLIHAVFPFLFEHTGSRAIDELNQRMASRRRSPAGIAVEKRLSL